MKTLLTSLGGGLLLGTGLKLGEARSEAAAAARRAERRRAANLERLMERIRLTEKRLRELEATGPPPLAQSRSAPSRVRSLKTRIATLERDISALAEDVAPVYHARPNMPDPTRPEPPAPEDEDLAQAVATDFQECVIDRIARLEEQSAGHASAVTELKECAARTEKSVQRLVSGLDRWLAVRPDGSDPAAERQRPGAIKPTSVSR